MITHPSSLIKRMYPSLVWEMPSKGNNLHLTFDDGPTPSVTDSLLDLLAKFNAKATFFCIGNNVVKYPLLVERIIKEGHKIGNHTFKHSNGWKSNTFDYLHDVNQFGEYIDTDLFRPPYGRVKSSQIKALRNKYKIVMWSILSMDYHPRYSKEKCFSLCEKKIKAGDIFVFHDSLKAKDKMLYCVEKLLEKYSTKYSFSSID